MKDYKLALVIMRAQLPTHAHFHLIREAYKKATHVLVLLGSANLAPSLRNPFSIHQRAAMLRAGLTSAELMHTHFAGLDDTPTDFEWEAQVLEHLEKAKDALGVFQDKDIVLVGHEKDETSYYVHSFPQLNTHLIESWGTLNATDARTALLTGGDLNPYTNIHVIKWLLAYYMADDFAEFGFNWLKAQHEAVSAFKKDYEGLPHGINFITGDALVICGSHVLLVERNGKVGYRQMALPGGFKEPGESIKACIHRELLEETVIDVPPRALRQGLRGIDPFSSPYRDPRGDFTTFCGVYKLELGTDGSLPKVKGSSDAKLAKWVHISELGNRSLNLFADHRNIIITQLRKYI